jgi:hypothetical protein
MGLIELSIFEAGESSSKLLLGDVDTVLTTVPEFTADSSEGVRAMRIASLVSNS